MASDLTPAQRDALADLAASPVPRPWRAVFGNRHAVAALLRRELIVEDAAGMVALTDTGREASARWGALPAPAGMERFTSPDAAASARARSAERRAARAAEAVGVRPKAGTAIPLTRSSEPSWNDLDDPTGRMNDRWAAELSRREAVAGERDEHWRDLR